MKDAYGLTVGETNGALYATVIIDPTKFEDALFRRIREENTKRRKLPCVPWGVILWYKFYPIGDLPRCRKYLRSLY